MTATRARLLAATLALAALVCGAAPASAGDLVVFVVPLAGDTGADGRRAYEAGATAASRIELTNRGETPIADVRVTARLENASPDGAEGDWQREDGVLTARIDRISAGETVSLRLAARLERGDEFAPPGTGGGARVRIEAGDPPLTALTTVRWPVASCANAYHAALRAVRVGPSADLADAIDSATEPEPDMPGRFVFDFDGADGDAPRLAAEFARARGADGWFRAEGVRWLTWRVSTDLDIYLDQPATAGLCTGVDAWADTLTGNLTRLTERRDELAKAVADLRDSVKAAVSGVTDAAGDDETAPADVRAAALLAALGGNAATTRADASERSPFAAIRAGLDDAASPPDEEQGSGGDRIVDRNALRRALGALERLWYLERRLAKTRAVADGFLDTFAAIRAAHARACTC